MVEYIRKKMKEEYWDALIEKDIPKVTEMLDFGVHVDAIDKRLGYTPLAFVLEHDDPGWSSRGFWWREGPMST